MPTTRKWTKSSSNSVNLSRPDSKGRRKSCKDRWIQLTRQIKSSTSSWKKSWIRCARCNSRASLSSVSSKLSLSRVSKTPLKSRRYSTSRLLEIWPPNRTSWLRGWTTSSKSCRVATSKWRLQYQWLTTSRRRRLMSFTSWSKISIRNSIRRYHSWKTQMPNCKEISVSARHKLLSKVLRSSRITMISSSSSTISQLSIQV